MIMNPILDDASIEAQPLGQLIDEKLFPVRIALKLSLEKVGLVWSKFTSSPRYLLLRRFVQKFLRFRFMTLIQGG